MTSTCGGGDLRLGLGEGDAERLGIDAEQQVARRDQLVLADRDLDDRARSTSGATETLSCWT